MNEAQFSFYLKYQDKVPKTDHNDIHNIQSSQYFTMHLITSKYVYPQKVICTPKC